MKRLLLVSSLACIGSCIGDSSRAAEPVSLSRYTLAHVGTGSPGVAIDQTPLEAMCRDEDGCDLILTWNHSPVDPATSEAFRTRLFLSPTNTVWYTSNDTSGADDDNIAGTVLGIASCGVRDVDPFIGDDMDIGFVLSAAADGTCRLVLID